MMKKTFMTITVIFTLIHSAHSQNRNTLLLPSRLGTEEINFLKKDLTEKEKFYDTDKKMLWSITREKHYHSDLDSGVIVHDTRSSIEYAVELMYTNEPANIQRGIDIVRTLLPMQEKDKDRPYCGVWPYYPEDPLKDRKTPVDYNWADFISVPLIEIIINFSEYTDNELKEQIREALILAANSIKKRNVKGDYTNICIMGTYVCYIVGDLYNLTEMSNYARNKLAYFYKYTKDNKGFTEYNSPTYTVIAMNELLRMKRAIINPEDKRMIDELYTMCWDVTARHFHYPSGQWCGPNLRAYSSLLTSDLKRLFYNASDGKIELPGDYPKIPNVITPHKIPEKLISRFTRQILPRMETDTFTIGKFQPGNKVTYPEAGTIYCKDIIGKLYAHPLYAIASVNQGYMWNQCRPLIMHWGSREKPVYMQVKFLHDFYDFSAINIVSIQDSATVLSILNTANNGGDKHPNIDRIKNQQFAASDIRLRFETGGEIAGTEFSITDKAQNKVCLQTDDFSCIIRLPYVNWSIGSGYWETGGEEGKKWIDYVIYSGNKRNFDFTEMQEAVIGLYLSVSTPENVKPENEEIIIEKENEYLKLSYKNLTVKALKKPEDEFRIKNDYETIFR